MRANRRASQSETRRARVHRRAAPEVPAWQPEIGSPTPATRTSARANRTATPRLLSLQIDRAQLEKRRRRQRVGLPESQRQVSLPSRHPTESQAILNPLRGLSGTPAGKATRTRSCNRAWHRVAESGATDPVEAACSQVTPIRQNENKGALSQLPPALGCQ